MQKLNLFDNRSFNFFYLRETERKVMLRDISRIQHQKNYLKDNANSEMKNIY